MRKFETFFYTPSVAEQKENESLRNVVILQYENDKRTKSSESVIPSVERDLATCIGKGAGFLTMFEMTETAASQFKIRKLFSKQNY